jgi:hypothetical protein
MHEDIAGTRLGRPKFANVQVFRRPKSLYYHRFHSQNPIIAKPLSNYTPQSLSCAQAVNFLKVPTPSIQPNTGSAT